jgi:hypothetical protein
VAVPSLGELWKLAKTVDRLLSSEKRNSESFAEIATRLEAIETRLTNLEARVNVPNANVGTTAGPCSATVDITPLVIIYPTNQTEQAEAG